MIASALWPCAPAGVTIQDLEGVAHTVEVTAESLFEAVAQGLAALRRSDWVAVFQQGIVKVSVADVRVEHQVTLTDFIEWLDRPGRSPRDIIQRQKNSINTWNAGHAVKLSDYPLLLDSYNSRL